MTRLLTDAMLAKMSAREAIGPGRAVLDDIKAHIARYPGHLVRIDGPRAALAVKELEALNEVVGQLADEVRAFRDNVQLQRDAPPPSADVCAACRKFRPLLSIRADRPPVNQALLTGTGACCASRPMLNKDGTGDKAVFTSMFTPVDPGHWCIEFERHDPEGDAA